MPNFDPHAGEQAYPFKSTHELHTYLQAGVDVVVADDRMSKYYISRVEQTKPINVKFWRDIYRNVELSHPTIGEMQNNSRIHLLKALKCKLNHALKLEDKSRPYSLKYLVGPTTPTGRSAEQKTRDFAIAYGHSGLPQMRTDMNTKMMESIMADKVAPTMYTMDMSKVEELAKSIYAMPSSSDSFSKQTTKHVHMNIKIKPTQVETTMQIERPINVIGDHGSVNILTASEETLARLIREAQAKIEAGKDLAGISKAFAKKQADLEKIIDLCVKQLDKVAK